MGCDVFVPDRERALAKYRSGWARTVYDRSSTRRDTSSQRRFERFFELRRKSIEQLGLKSGDTVLDVGSGSGLNFSELERWIGREGHLVGIEQSQDQLAAARALAESQGWRNIVLINSPVEEAEIPGEADAALFSFTHDIMRTPRALLNVLAHVKAGGRIVAIGVKWAPFWRPLTNWRTWRGSKDFVTTFEGFDKPWSLLEKSVSSLEVECAIAPTPLVGTISLYIAVATK